MAVLHIRWQCQAYSLRICCCWFSREALVVSSGNDIILMMQGRLGCAKNVLLANASSPFDVVLPEDDLTRMFNKCPHVVQHRIGRAPGSLSFSMVSERRPLDTRENVLLVDGTVQLSQYLIALVVLVLKVSDSQLIGRDSGVIKRERFVLLHSNMRARRQEIWPVPTVSG